MAAIKKPIKMKVGVDALWDAITDYEGYPDFVDGCTASKVKKRKGDTATVEYTVSKIKTFTYTLEHKEVPKKSMSWKMIDGEFFKSNTGSWEIEDKGKDGLEVTYEIDVGFPLLVPKAIVNGLVATSLPEMLDGFANRAKKLDKKNAKKK